MRKKISYICLFILFIVKNSYAIGGVSVLPTPFVTTWQTDGSNNIIIPLTGGGYDFTIEWGDGTTEIKIGTPGNISHTYSTAGVKTVSITANVLNGFPRIYVNNFGNGPLLKTIESWGSGQWGSSVSGAFYGATNLEVNALDIPNFSATTNFDSMFWNCTSVTGAYGFYNWNLNVATSFLQMFRGATIFNGDIGGWVFSTDINKIISAQSMFMNASSFNQDISSWNVGRFTNMKSMFQSATVFNQNILSWNVENVTNMAGMFNAAVAFNQDISTWNTSNVTVMNSMFQNATAFNNDISNWDVSNVTNMSSMFNNAMAFNQDISTWNISKVTTLQNFLLNGKLSRANYDALLLGWSTLDAGETLVPINLNAHFGSSKYSNDTNVLTARNTTLIANKGWTITDGGTDPDAIVPYIVSNTLASNNATITITFSENVYRTDVGSGSLEATDFLFSLSGGSATLNTIIPNSVSASNNLTFDLGIDINGTPDGTEVLTVTPVLNSIFDISGNAAATTQSNNTAQLKDLTNPIITGPSNTIGLTSSISINENTAAVHTFSANETVSWTLGNANDEALFSIDNIGNLVFTSAPDYETPSSTLNSNSYIVEVIATDAANNKTNQTLTINIKDVPSATISNVSNQTKYYFDTNYIIAAPTSNGTGLFTYVSSDPTVATISGTTVTITGLGTTTISITQTADATYDNTTVNSILTVNSVSVVTKNGQITSTIANYVNKYGAIASENGISSTGKILSAKTSTIPAFTQFTVPFQNYFDLETDSPCGGSCFGSVLDIFDLTFAAGTGPVRARMWWNEQYADMALVYDKSFNSLTLADVSNYYFCDYVGDVNGACVNVDTPPTNFVGIYHTFENNYFVVEYISENTTDVTFKYRKLN